MPFTFDFDLANGILRCRLAGRITDRELREFFRTGADLAVRVHPAAGVIDLSGVTAFDVSSKTIREQSRVEPALRDPELKRVVIAPASDTFGMMRMFELEGQDVRPDIHVVRSEKEAWAILAVENPAFQPL
ncbi:MAG: hypothetical protein KGL75_08540 [Acidobacteriota bacterium]|nr:hypothetical protein [Acidobacteriota bacterium]